MSAHLHLGDCRDVLRGMPYNSVDSIVTDPPYGLEFMGKDWDHGVPCVDTWKEALRVLKPGGYLLSFGGSRMYHRMACAVEDAGFEIRDQIMWVYGSGFPKSHNGEWGGTALKPAHEPIVVARKPLIGTVEANWLAFGTGALNIDGCRVEASADDVARAAVPQPAFNSPTGAIYNMKTGEGRNGDRFDMSAGRWPANLIHDGSDEVLAAFPQAPGQQAAVSGTAPSAKTSNVYGAMKRVGEASQDDDNEGAVGFKMKPGARRLDTGSAARFFYCAKANKKDRDEGLGHMPEVACGMMEDDNYAIKTGSGNLRDTRRRNTHPTVKPTDLMAYLCRLVTPAGGVVLDPFMGSGSTGKAAVREGFRFIGIEREAAYLAIAQARIDHELVGDLL